MTVIPVVFCFDDNWQIPAGVCITSLLEHAKKNTFYDIFILYSETSSFQKTGTLSRLQDHYPNCKITFRSVGTSFKNAFQIRGINNTTYYRLLIPELIPEYDKIMYHDVDVIFRSDLADIFLSTDMDEYYIGGVVSTGGLVPSVREKRAKLGFDWRSYILAGNIILNSKKLREDGIVKLFKREVETSSYEYQDMDIINIVCKGKLKRMEPVFCVTIGISELAANTIDQPLYSSLELQNAQKQGTIHYNGPKPWNEYCPNFDIWWEYYRNSIFFDPKYYFDFYNSKLTYLDEMPLLQRIKQVFRFFKTGGKFN